VGERILLIEDDSRLAGMVREYLGKAGFHVIHAENGTRGLALHGREPVDAVILDMVMPDRDGMEALRELKKLYPATKVLTVSGVHDSDLFLNVSAYLGADASLNKSEVASLPAMLDLVLDL